MTAIYDELQREHEQHQPATPATTGYDQPDTQEAPVNLLADIRAEVARAVTWTEDELRSALPTVAKVADDAAALAASAPAQAILSAVLSPADEAWIVGLVQRLDQSAHQAEENLHAGDPQPAPAQDAPAAEPAFVPAGPVTGGQAQ